VGNPRIDLCVSNFSVLSDGILYCVGNPRIDLCVSNFTPKQTSNGLLQACLDLCDIFSLCLNRQDDQTVGKGCSDVTRSKEKDQIGTPGMLWPPSTTNPFPMM
jgi:hypothetical protein